MRIYFKTVSRKSFSQRCSAAKIAKSALLSTFFLQLAKNIAPVREICFPNWSGFKRYANRHLRHIHAIQQVLVVRNLMIPHLGGGDRVEEFPCAINLRTLDLGDVHGIHRSLGLRDEEGMLHARLLHSDRPIWRIVTHGSRDLKGTGQFGIDHHHFGLVQIMRELTLSLAIAKHIVRDVFLGGILVCPLPSRNAAASRSIPRQSFEWISQSVHNCHN